MSDTAVLLTKKNKSFFSKECEASDQVLPKKILSDISIRVYIWVVLHVTDGTFNTFSNFVQPLVSTCKLLKYVCCVFLVPTTYEKTTSKGLDLIFKLKGTVGNRNSVTDGTG